MKSTIYKGDVVINPKKMITRIIIKICDISNKSGILILKCKVLSKINSISLSKGDIIHVLYEGFDKYVKNHKFLSIPNNNENITCLIGNTSNKNKLDQIRDIKCNIEHYFLLFNKIRISDISTLVICNVDIEEKCKYLSEISISYELKNNGMCKFLSFITSNKELYNDLFSLYDSKNDIGMEYTVGYVWTSNEEENISKSCNVIMLRIVNLLDNGDFLSVDSEEDIIITDIKMYESNVNMINVTSGSVESKAIEILCSKCDFVCIYYKKTASLILDWIKMSNTINIPVLIEMYKIREIPPYSNVRELADELFRENVFTPYICHSDLPNTNLLIKYLSNILKMKHTIFMYYNILNYAVKISRLTCSNLNSSIKSYSSELSMNLISSWTFTYNLNSDGEYFRFLVSDYWKRYNIFITENINEDSNGGFINHEKGIFEDTILLDYNACYPLILIENNLCISNIYINPIDRVIKKKSLIKRCTINTKKKTLHIYTPDSNILQGILPELLNSLYITREKTKGRDNYSIKLLMNCIYGNLGNFHSKLIAFVICKIQRTRLERIKTSISYIKGLSCVYCHTDGIMLNVIKGNEIHKLIYDYLKDCKSSNTSGIISIINSHLKKIDGNEIFDLRLVHIDNIFKRIMIKNSLSYVGISRNGVLVHKGFTLKNGIFIRDTILYMYNSMLRNNNAREIKSSFNKCNISEIPLSWFTRKQKITVDYNENNDTKKVSNSHNDQLQNARIFYIKNINSYTSDNSIKPIVKFLNVKHRNGSSRIISIYEYNKSNYSIDYNFYIREINSEINLINFELDKLYSHAQLRIPVLKLPIIITEDEVIKASYSYGYNNSLKKISISNSKKNMNEKCLECKLNGNFNQVKLEDINFSICNNTSCTIFFNKSFF